MVDAHVVDAKTAAMNTIGRDQCGYCGGNMPQGKWKLQKDMCPCGNRRISSLGSGMVLIHQEGCDGGNCSCGNVFN